MAGRRSIFEEVGAGARIVPEGGMIAGHRPGARGAIRIWLMALFALVVVMIAVGGLTRLSDAGLSITEWKPVTGVLPPLDAAAWQAEFARYQASPQYRIANSGMTLDAFRTLYWWEWGHRQLGRVIGLVWAAGFLGLLALGRLPPGWTRRLLGLGALIGLQGVVGWWMVASGLQAGQVTVASYRLAVHLGLAFVILGVIVRYVLLLGRRETDLLQARRSREARLFGLSTGLMHFVLLQVVLGALVAGIDAGRAFPTWPDMNGQFFPADAFYVPGRPVWAAFFENAGLVQFIHRMSAYLLFVFGLIVWLRGRRSAHRVTRGAFNAVMAMLVVQVALGIGTALSGAALHPALTHQLGAVVLWVLVLRARHLALYPRAGSIREGTA